MRIVDVIPTEVPEGSESRPANRKERRDHIKSLPRFVRLDYGFGKLYHETPGVFIAPARGR